MRERITRDLLPVLIVVAIITYSLAILLLILKERLSIEIFLGATGGLIGLMGFLAERYEKIVARRVELQTDFYKQWMKLRREIIILRGKSDEVKAREKFTEYFEFLNHEFDMAHHLNPKFLKFYEAYRKYEFQDPHQYGTKTHREWWCMISEYTLTQEFKNSISKLL